MISEEAKILFENEPVFVGSSNLDSSPNITIVDGCKVLDDNKILFTDVQMTLCNKNLISNPQCCLIAYSHNDLYGFKAFGLVEYHKNGQYLDLAQNSLKDQSLEARGAVLFKVKNIFKVE